MKKALFILIVISFTLKIQAQTTSYQNSPILEDADTMPEYKGGMDNFYYKLSQIHYTFSDRMYGCQGRVTVMMVVEKDGSISNLKIVNGLSAKQDEEILRVVRRLNKWKPGTANGEPVRVLCAIPINFKIKQPS
ncbi:energy transducer TonB [Mucilaginibacter sp. UYCu711]|uniref:energy transducer TonB n=1 Tax=Mucilaginibacter sp. UYCu711 TaxID=3156339 RepID=UPI003D215C9A